MNLNKLYLSTLITEFPAVINYNNDQFKSYLDLFYNEEKKIIVVPVTTTGKVKGATGEFVNMVVDNLTVKKQFTNLYDNNTSADYNYYKMYIDPVTIGRDPCTYGIDTSVWNFPYEPSAYNVVDVNKPYYKFSGSNDVFLANDNLSQVVGIYYDASTTGVNILLDPCVGTISSTTAANTYKEFICVAFDASWGSTWILYK